MAADLTDAGPDYFYEVNHPNENREKTPSECETNFDKEDVERKKKTLNKERSLNILCVGGTGVGKSALINAMLGDTVALVKCGPKSVQDEVEVHIGKHDDIKVNVYDTVGFSDSAINRTTIVNRISNVNVKGGFDLMLICLKMDARAEEGVKKMLSRLGKLIDEEMWKRAVIVLTFANFFCNLGDFKKLTKDGKREKIKRTRDEFKELILDYTCDSVAADVVKEIPIVLAGEESDWSLPTVNNWLFTLWETAILRCKDDSKPFLARLSGKHLLAEVGMSSATVVGGIAVGGVVGGVVGTAAIPLPVVGTAVGAGVGAAIGGVGTVVASGVGVTVAHQYKKSKQRRQSLIAIEAIRGEGQNDPGTADKEGSEVREVEKEDIITQVLTQDVTIEQKMGFEENDHSLPTLAMESFGEDIFTAIDLDSLTTFTKLAS